MKSQSAQKEKLQQTYQSLDWKKSAYQDFGTKLSTLRDSLYDNFALTSSWNVKTASSSNSSVATVTATGSTTGNISISKIQALATSSDPSVGTKLAGVTGSNTLQSIGVASDGNITLSTMQQDGTMKATTISYSKADTIDSFVSKLNSQTGGSISAVFANGQLSLSTNNTGSSTTGYAIQVTGTSSPTSVLNSLGFASSDIQADGEDAKYTLSGIDMTSKSNTITTNGYKITLKDTLNAVDINNNPIGTQGAPVAISSQTNTDALVDKITSFVNQYNDLISSIRTSINQKKNYNYPPLTDAQKSEMSEKEITAWEDKAKEGILRNDPILSGVENSLRSQLNDKLGTSSLFSTLSSIGITTTKDYKSGGKLEIDKDKLKAALEQDPDAVVQIFTSPTGVISKTRGILKTGVDSIKGVAGLANSANNTSSLGRQLLSTQKTITDWTDRLKKIENHYWSQFTAMEQAIEKANKTSSIFANG